MLLASQEGDRFNPSAIGIGFLSAAANASMLNLTTSNPRVHGFAARTRDGDASLRVYVINKMETAQTLRLRLPAGTSLEHGAAMVDTDDHWGTTRALTVDCSGTCDLLLPAVSFSMFSG